MLPLFFKKVTNSQLKTIGQYLFFPFVGNSSRKLCLINRLYNFPTSNNLITKNQSGFRPRDSITKQLLLLVDKIHRSFETSPSLEVRAIFLDISKNFDKVWHEGLVFNLK